MVKHEFLVCFDFFVWAALILSFMRAQTLIKKGRVTDGALRGIQTLIYYFCYLAISGMVSYEWW